MKITIKEQLKRILSLSIAKRLRKAESFDSIESQYQSKEVTNKLESLMKKKQDKQKCKNRQNDRDSKSEIVSYANVENLHIQNFLHVHDNKTECESVDTDWSYWKNNERDDLY